MCAASSGICEFDQLSDAHYLLWHSGELLVANTGHNDILWLNPLGEIVRVWRAPGENDSWHLNDLLIHKGRLLACAFGRYTRYREYKERLHAGDGLVFDVESGHTVLNGLCGPHSPRFFDGAWAVCNSLRNEVLQIEDGTGAVLRRVALRSFTRGIAFTDDLLFVGESANRHEFLTGQTAAICVLSRRDWTVLGRIPVPFTEISDIVIAPPDLVEGARTGFRTNPLRAAEQDQLWPFQQVGVSPRRIWALTAPLEPSQIRANIHATLPRTMKAAATVTVDCQIANGSNACFSSAPPYPVHLSYKWLRADGALFSEAPEGLRSALPRPLDPGQSISCRMDVAVPPIAGSYLLRLTAVQENVAWFDEMDAGSSCSGLVQVE